MFFLKLWGLVWPIQNSYLVSGVLEFFLMVTHLICFSMDQKTTIILIWIIDFPYTFYKLNINIEEELFLFLSIPYGPTAFKLVVIMYKIFSNWYIIANKVIFFQPDSRCCFRFVGFLTLRQAYPCWGSAMSKINHHSLIIFRVLGTLPCLWHALSHLFLMITAWGK